MKLWKGIEREGKFKGTYTLFVGGPVNANIIEHIEIELYHNKLIKQIYFGAGRCMPIDYEVVDLVLQYFKIQVTLEVDINNILQVPIKFARECHIIITINNSNLSQVKILSNKCKSMQLKLQSLNNNPNILIIDDLKNFQEVDISTLNNKVYEGDEVIV